MKDRENTIAPADDGACTAARPRTAGFRFSAADGGAIAICAAATLLLWNATGGMVLLFPVVLAHFFLFCKAFRVRRQPELIWTAVFLMNFAGWFLSGHFSWPGVLAIQTPLTAYLLYRETRRPCYHGIFAHRWNSRNLDRYLAGEF